MEGGMKNRRFLTNISLYFENCTKYRLYSHSYNGRPVLSRTIHRSAPFSVTLNDP